MNWRDELREEFAQEEKCAQRAIAAGLSSFPHVYHDVLFESEDAYDLPEDAPEDQHRAARRARTIVPDPAYANVISSKVLMDQWPDDEDDHLHTVALDIDLPARLVESTTPGHYHLYIDKAMPWRDYRQLLRVMGEVGLLEEGYVGVSERRGATHLRLPWVKKAAVSDG